MSKHRVQGARPRAVNYTYSPVSKSPRDALWRMTVIASHCAEALPRVLGMIAQQALIPVSVGLSREPQTLVLDIVVDGLDEHAATRLMRRVERIVTIQSVRLSQGLDMPTSAMG